MKKLYFIITLTILLLSLQDVKPVFSADDQPFYATRKVMPNVLIILDRSGSMQWIVTDNVDGSCTTTTPDTTTTQANKSRVCIARDVLFDLLDDDNNGKTDCSDAACVGFAGCINKPQVKSACNNNLYSY